jgi:sugar phosphate isomerase/epimerase
MAVYVSTTYFGDGSKVQDALEDLEKLKIKNIELGSNHASSNLNKLKLSKVNNYIVHNYFPPQEKDFILNIASDSSKVRKKSIRFIQNTINWCQKKGIKYYTIHPGFFAEAISQLGHSGKNRNFDLKFLTSSPKNRKQTLEETIKVITDLYRLSNDKVQLLIENQGSQTSKNVTIFDSIEELQLLKKAVGERLKFNFNLAHATLSGTDLNESKVFQYVFKNSPFFEVSEIKGIYDSHLPLRPDNGRILQLIKNYKDLFKKRNVILEYRNVHGSKLLKSFNFINEMLA